MFKNKKDILKVKKKFGTKPLSDPKFIFKALNSIERHSRNKKEI